MIFKTKPDVECVAVQNAILVICKDKFPNLYTVQEMFLINLQKIFLKKREKYTIYKMRKKNKIKIFHTTNSLDVGNILSP